MYSYIEWAATSTRKFWYSITGVSLPEDMEEEYTPPSPLEPSKSIVNNIISIKRQKNLQINRFSKTLRVDQLTCRLIL